MSSSFFRVFWLSLFMEDNYSGKSVRFKNTFCGQQRVSDVVSTDVVFSTAVFVSTAVIVFEAVVFSSAVGILDAVVFSSAVIILEAVEAL